MPQDVSRIDIPFHIPQVHRLRCTEDLFGRDAAVLRELLEPSGDCAARVQVWLDGDLARALPQLQARIEACLLARPDEICLVSPVETIVGGEACKNNPGIIDGLLERFHHDDLDRRSYVIVVGGGAVLDAVGFAAAIAHRGIRLIRVPSTTLAQADSGVGVKNAVNWFGKKNWKGTFAVPWAVINDRGLLQSLSDRDFRNGFSEAIKVSLLKDPSAFQQLCRDAKKIAARDPVATAEAIAMSVRMHLDHITMGGDPFEALEARPLDFGHWSAHRMEAMTHYQIRHGEAVSIGVAIDTVYSSLAHGFPSGDVDLVLECLLRLKLPVSHPILEQTGALRSGLEEFRQHLGGRLTVTMLQAIGVPINVHEVDWRLMEKAISIVRAYDRPVAATK